uniref:Uncharacterized protein n=1 Tax=Sphaerodactylus townsendi TaxID=933632 RepID=A0ACB8F100_9SAUR
MITKEPPGWLRIFAMELRPQTGPPEYQKDQPTRSPPWRNVSTWLHTAGGHNANVSPRHRQLHGAPADQPVGGCPAAQGPSMNVRGQENLPLKKRKDHSASNHLYNTSVVPGQAPGSWPQLCN